MSSSKMRCKNSGHDNEINREAGSTALPIYASKNVMSTKAVNCFILAIVCMCAKAVGADNNRLHRSVYLPSPPAKVGEAPIKISVGAN